MSLKKVHDNQPDNFEFNKKNLEEIDIILLLNEKIKAK